MNSLFQTYVIVRLNRWGRYVRWANSGRSVGPARVGSWWERIMRERVQESVSASESVSSCPVDIEEASETNQCVAALPQHLRETVFEDYVMLGNQAQKAQALGISDRMFRLRRDEAQVILLELFNLAAAGLPLDVARPAIGRPPKLRCIA